MNDCIEKWYQWLAFIFFILLCLTPLGVSIFLAIVYSPWWLFVLTTYLIFGPFMVHGIVTMYDCIVNW